MRKVFTDTGLPIRVSRTLEQNKRRHTCVCCGETEGIASFSLVVNAEMTQNLDYCRECSQQIAVYIATSWSVQPDSIDLDQDEPLITVADEEKLLAVEKLLSVCVQLASELSGKNLLGNEIMHVEGHLRSLLLTLITHGMRSREVFGEQSQLLDSWATVLDIIEAALEGDTSKTKDYTNLLLERLEDHHMEFMAKHLKRLLSGVKGQQILLATEEETGA